MSEQPRIESSRPCSAALWVPVELRHWPIALLDLSVRVANALHRSGAVSLGALDGVTNVDLLGGCGLDDNAHAQLRDALQRLTTVPAIGRVVAVDSAGTTLTPHVSGKVLVAVASADTLDDELRGLLASLTGRDATMVYDRWSSLFGDTLDEIGQRYGITRERVRQIVDRHNSRLRGSNLRLPLSAQVVQLVEQNVGMTTGRLVRDARTIGITLTVRTLNVLQSVSALGITEGHLVYSPTHRLWFSDTGIADWLNSNRLIELKRSIDRRVRKRLNKTGSITRAELARLSPFGRAHAIGVALKGNTKILRIGNHLIPVPSLDTPLTRAIQKMLAVSPLLNIADIHSGLHGAPRLEVPPLDVVHAQLANHRDFAIAGDCVTSRSPVPRQNILSPAENAAVDALESTGGLILWTEFDEAVQQAGFSHATTAVILRQPFIIRRAIAIYGLRGHPLDHALLRTKIRQRKVARRNEVTRATRLNEDTIEVQFTLTPFSIQGALAVPAEVAHLRIARWRGVFPGGKERSLAASNGFIWNVQPWLRSAGAQVGDVVVATFYFSEARVEFDEPVSQRSVIDG